MSTSRRAPVSRLMQELLDGDFRPAPLPVDGMARSTGEWEESILPLDESLFARLKDLESIDQRLPTAMMMVCYAVLFSLYSGEDSAVVCLPVFIKDVCRPVAVRVKAGPQRTLEELTQSALQKLRRLAQGRAEDWENLDPRLYRFVLEGDTRLSLTSSSVCSKGGDEQDGLSTLCPVKGDRADDLPMSRLHRDDVREDFPCREGDGKDCANRYSHAGMKPGDSARPCSRNGISPDDSLTPCSHNISGPDGSTPSPLEGWNKEYAHTGMTARLTADGRLVQRYRAGLFSPSWFCQMEKYLLRILSVALSNPGTRVGDIELAPPSVAVSEHAGDPAPKSVIAQLEHICQTTPRQICLSEGERNISYGQFWQYIQSLRRRLLLAGVQPGQTVAVLAGRSMEAACAMFAIFTSGGVYLPIDRSLPAGRIRAILDDSRPAAVLCDADQEKTLPPGLPVLNIQCEDESLSLTDAPPSPTDAGTVKAPTPQSPAYLIYTSGSTGRPKGALLPWEGIARLGNFFRGELGIGPQDVVGQFASLSFDASVWETLMALLTGAKLVILPEQARTDPRLFQSQVTQNGVTVLTLPPHFASLLEPTDFPTLRMMITAGSSPSATLAERWSRRMDYFNAYGPTEASICCTICRFPRTGSPAQRITAGLPMGDCTIRIVGPDDRARPPFLPGEIVVEGEGVALEYLHEKERSQQKIRPGRPGKRRYYTGDIGRLVEGGRLEILGRGDAQLKLRGYRIEPEEIRQTLLSLGLADDAAVISKPDRSGDERLCAYLVAPRTADKGKLDRLLGEYLPAYMLPDHYQSIDAIPLSPSGKVDAAALPNPWAGPKAVAPAICGREDTPKTNPERSGPGQQQTHKGVFIDRLPKPKCSFQACEDQNPPSGKAEGRNPIDPPPRAADELLPTLKALWADLLEVEDIAPQDEFFRLGGQSLKAIRLRAKIEEVFSIRLDIKEIYAHPSLQGMAEQIAGHTHHTPPKGPTATH